MRGASESESSHATLRVVGIESLPPGWVEKVIELGDQHKAQLGLLRYSGFREAASKSNIVLALRAAGDGSELLAGYCLYDPTVRADRYARIVHLCVKSDARGLGIARRLIDAVMDRCDDRLGLRLKCRDDWTAAAAWPALKFEPIRSRRGRGKTQEPMTEWARRNPEATDLLALPDEDLDSLVVAVDSNVFCDLYGKSESRRTQFSGRVALLAASEQIRLVRPFSVTLELNKITNTRERDALLGFAHVGEVKLLESDPSQVRLLRDQFLARIPSEVLAKDDSLRMDATLIAESVLGGADVFVTRDANAVTYIGPIAAQGRDFTVLDPVELPAFIDRRADVSDYLPERLEETHVQVMRGDAAIWHPETLMVMLNQDRGERKVTFRAHIKDLAVTSAGTDDRQVMVTPSGDVLAIWAARLDGTRLNVSLLRISGGELLPTIARQVSRMLRRRAADSGATTVQVTDEYVADSVANELRRDGFADQAGALNATVLTTIGPWRDVRDAALAASVSGVVLPTDLTSAVEVSEFERILWPAKVLHAKLPTYIVPIRGVFADDLLGHEPTLVARPEDLGLSREHVYYKSGQSCPPAPGRILWYSSRRDMAIVACSRLVESVKGTPEVLHREFSNIGVWTLDQVREARERRRGKVSALRFADTEFFVRRIPFDRVQALSGAAARLTLRSATPIDSEVFERIYREGMRR